MSKAQSRELCLRANSTLIALWSVKRYVCLCVCVLKANNQNLGFTYGMDMMLMGGEVTYIRNRLETGGFNATEYSKSRGKKNNQAYV